MKEEFELKTKEAKELSVEKLQQKERQLIGQLQPKNGHRVFEVNLDTGEIKEAEYDPQLTFILGQTQKKSITSKEDCIYISALNLKNAQKKYRKLLTDFKNYLKEENNHE